MSKKEIVNVDELESVLITIANQIRKIFGKSEKLSFP
jgi:hypothetical protein